jgi:SEC-C motif-containing protein
MNSDSEKQCLCGSGSIYGDCCELLHSGARRAGTAEQLMRSRFSAYAQRNIAYLAETWDSSTRPADIDLSKEDVTWIRLEIASLKKGAKSDKKGIVEFRAFYDRNGEQHVMREISRFRKVENQWYYLDGTVKSIGKAGAQINLGRNAPCPCGSGKKAKRCCG